MEGVTISLALSRRLDKIVIIFMLRLYEFGALYVGRGSSK